jgi:D-alanyl-D-alanine carboxypeptidase
MSLQAMRGVILAVILTVCAVPAVAAPYAAYVMDARTGEVLHSQNADTKLHPASLTKMMTLYLVFNELKAGRMSVDQMVTISKKAASQPPSKLGLKPGQRIALRYLIRAAAVKSANDCAMALAEAVAGSQSAFADRMNAAARAMGMNNTHFVNPHGLTESGHYSSAHDMALLGRRLFYDFPEYYNLFSRLSTSAGVATVYNTNRRLLGSYEGADGIKTGYTSAAGFNLVSSARRGNERVIVAMFGGKSSASRNARVAELMDLGFQKMPSRVAEHRPPPINIDQAIRVASVANTTTAPTRARLDNASRPRLRPDDGNLEVARASVNSVAEAVVLATRNMPSMPQIENGAQDASTAGIETRRVVVRRSGDDAVRPRLRPQEAEMERVASLVPMPTTQMPEQVKTVRNDGANPDWGVQVGQFSTRNEAERHLLTTALQDIQALDGSKRRIVEARSSGAPVFKAQFIGLSASAASNACERLNARAESCEAINIGG